jgi:hypothetical protein
MYSTVTFQEEAKELLELPGLKLLHCWHSRISTGLSVKDSIIIFKNRR